MDTPSTCGDRAGPVDIHNGRQCTQTVDKVIANGGEIAQPLGVDAPEITARFRDPAGNVIGLYQEPSR